MANNIRKLWLAGLVDFPLRRRIFLVPLLIAVGLLIAPDVSANGKESSKSVAEVLEEKIRSGTFNESDKYKLRTLPRNVKQDLKATLRQVMPGDGPSPEPLPHEANLQAPRKSNMQAPVHWVTVLMITGFAVLLLFTSKNATPRVLRDLLSRVANFVCPDCRRPICQIGALNASIVRVSRNSSEWAEIDEDQLTPRQRFGREAIWINAECPFCRRVLFFDEFGLPTGDPFTKTDSESAPEPASQASDQRAPRKPRLAPSRA